MRYKITTQNMTVYYFNDYNKAVRFALSQLDYTVVYDTVHPGEYMHKIAFVSYGEA